MLKNKLTEDQKNFLLNYLMKNDQESDEEKLQKEVSELVKEIMYSRCIPEELKEHLEKPGISKICIQTKICDSFDLETQLGISETYIPDGEDKTKNQCIDMYRVYVDFDLPIYFDINNGTKRFEPVKDFLSVCKEEELDIIRNLVMKYLDKQYKKVNRYNQFMKSPGSAYDRGFLYDINTWEDLKRLNEDWYEIIYNRYKDNLCKDAISAMNKLEINDKIKNLRNLIEL
jgi:hypothetical protein